MIFSQFMKLAAKVHEADIGEGKVLQTRRIEAGKLLMAESKHKYNLRSMTDKMLFYCLIDEYLKVIKHCHCHELFCLRIDAELLKMDILTKLVSSQDVTDASAEAYLANSPNYSREFKVVVARDGDGSSCEDYEIHSDQLPMDFDDYDAVNKFFPDWQEFLMDEDGRLMEQGLREVSVRTIRLGRKLFVAEIPEPYAKVEMIDLHSKETTVGNLLEVLVGDGTTVISLKVDGDDGVRNLDLRFHQFTSIEQNLFGEAKTTDFYTNDPHDQIGALGMCNDLIKAIG